MDAPITTVPRVLLVDDSRMVRASIVKHIRSSYDVREEGDGEAAWQALLLDPSIGAVISDLSMPKLDGYGLLERIRSSKVARIQALPVIMISGDEDEVARTRAKECGATDFITKGIGTAELLTRLASSVEAAKARRDLAESREALTRAKPVDPRLGIVTREFLLAHGDQLISLARRGLGPDVSVMILAVDRLDELTARYGSQISGLIMRKLAKIIAAKVRKEDAVAQLDDRSFCMVSPTINLSATGTFALRLCAAIESVALGYRGDILRIGVSIGMANSQQDTAQPLGALMERAAERLRLGESSGGSRVIGATGEVRRAAAEPAMGLDRAAALAEQQSIGELREHGMDILSRIVPLLYFLENEFQLGIPMDAVLRRLVERRQTASTTTSRHVDQSQG